MKCPFCSHRDSRVIDSRAVEEGCSIRRRRECPNCGKRFTTYEKYEERKQMRQYGQNKKIKEIADSIERELRMSADAEIPSAQIGELVMKYLEQTDQIAYVRFASVYRQFADVRNFMQELERIMQKSKDAK